jgi:hypothetical protein
MSPVYTRPGVASSTSSHSARPQVDYDLSFGSHPRSPSRYFGCLTFEMSTQLAQELARPAATLTTQRRHVVDGPWQFSFQTAASTD